MNLEELRKLVSDTKGLVADELFFKDDAELITGLSDAVLALLDRVETAEAALARVREAIEREKHWNDECGWDVPLIALTCALEGDE